MSVFVDDMRAPFGRLVMCHMWADTLPELHDMADRIGVARKWFQCPPKASWDHYDVALSMRARAVALGAVETDKYEPAAHVARLRIKNTRDPSVIASALDRLLMIEKSREIHRNHA